jgi:O-antigen/teichoic acid export membrane protein
MSADRPRDPARGRRRCAGIHRCETRSLSDTTLSAGEDSLALEPDVARQPPEGGGIAPPAGRARRLASQSALYGLAGGLGKALALLTVPIISRLLTPAEYGLADLANTLAAMLALVALFAGDVPAARLLGRATIPSERRMILSSNIWVTIVLSTAMAAMLLPLAGVIAGDVWSAPESILIAVLAIVLIPVGAVQAGLVTTQRLEGRPVVFAVLATIDLLAQMVLAVWFVAIGWGPLGMVAGFVIGSLVGLAAALTQTYSLILSWPDWRLGGRMLREGLAFLPATVAFVVTNYAVRYLLVDALGQGSVGLFGVAVRLAGGMALVTGAFSLAWGPFGLALPDSTSTARLFGRVMRAFAVVAVLAALALGAIAPELVTLISGDAYLRAATMLPGLLVSAAMMGAFYVLLVAAGVTGRGRAVAYAAVSGALVQVVTTAALLPWLGLQAVGVGAVLGQAMAIILLAIAVGSSVHRGQEAVLAMCAGGVVAILLQALNSTPDASFVLRFGFAAIATVAAAWVGLRLLRRLPRAPSHGSSP